MTHYMLMNFLMAFVEHRNRRLFINAICITSRKKKIEQICRKIIVTKVMVTEVVWGNQSSKLI